MWQGLRRGYSGSMAPLAWGLIPLFLLIVLLIFFFGTPLEEPRVPQTLESSANRETLWLGRPQVPDIEWATAYVPPSEEVRAALLRQLSSFRAERPQLGIRLTVTAAQDDEAGREAARQLGNALGQYGFGRSGDPETPPEGWEDRPLLRASPRDRGMVHHLLGALSPYLKGEVRVYYAERVHAGNMTLYLSGTPVFGPEGTIWYGISNDE